MPSGRKGAATGNLRAGLRLLLLGVLLASNSSSWSADLELPKRVPVRIGSRHFVGHHPRGRHVVRRHPILRVVRRPPLPNTLPTGGLTATDISAGYGLGAAVSMLSVGTGLCALISCPNDAKILADCGSRSAGISAGLIANAKTFFNAVVGQTDPLYIVVSHADDDHYGLIENFVGTHPVEAVVLGGYQYNYNKNFRTWYNALKNKNGNPTPVKINLKDKYHDRVGSPNPNIYCAGLNGGGDGFFILTVNAGTSKNDQSMIAKLKYGVFSAIFMGDAEKLSVRSAEENYTTTSSFLQTTLLEAAHHGAESKGANPPDWAEATLPNAVVFSAGTAYTNYGHPRCVSLETYQNVPSAHISNAITHPLTCYRGSNNVSSNIQQAFYNTRDMGAVVVLSDGADWGLWTCATNTIASCAVSVPVTPVDAAVR
jgi:beta-lactamase superfamily II metal-dependent hydrolase